MYILVLVAYILDIVKNIHGKDENKLHLHPVLGGCRRSGRFYPVPFQQRADFRLFSSETPVQDVGIFGAAFRQDVLTERTGCLPVEDPRFFEDRESISIQDFRPFVAVIAG